MRRLWSNGKAQFRRTILVVVVFTLGIVVGTTSSMELTKADYRWWSELSEDTKKIKVESAFDAYQDGWARGSDAEGFRIDAASENAAQGGIISNATATYIKGIVYKKDGSGHFVSYQKAPTFGKTFGAYQALIDDYYTRFESGRKATIGDILTCLTDQPTMTCAEVAKNVEK